MRVLGVLLVAGCAGAEGPDCVALVDGAWVLDGDPFGTPVGADLTMDPDACTFTLGWNMGVDLPTGGAVDGDRLTLAGDDELWATCTAKIDAEGTSAEGTCDTGPFTLVLEAAQPVR